MLSPVIKRPQRSATNRRRERGVTLALVALAIFSIIAMAGLSIDVGTLYQASAEAQRVADAAALAGAQAISISGITGAATPATNTTSWQQICGATGIATEAAIAVAQQNSIAGAAPTSTTVTYSAANGAVSPGASDCSTLTGAFGVNPVVTVKVTRSSLPTYFSRIWGRSGSSVSATASAEVFNPSNSGTYSSNGDVVPVQPRCVKPFIVPNKDPGNGGSPFVSTAAGAINNPGISPGSVIGESFALTADCKHGVTNCEIGPNNILKNPPQSNPPNNAIGEPAPALQYVPALISGTPTAVPSCATADNFQEAIAGCDQTTAYTCGVPAALGTTTQVDLTENPVNPHSQTGDTSTALQCLIHSSGLGPPPQGQDQLVPATFPFQIQAGSNNPLVQDGLVASNSNITTSSSIVTIPIYDSTSGPLTGNQPPVTIVGFLQVFVNNIVPDGQLINVTVLNVAGCGNGQTTTVSSNPVFGTSPVPVRLITPP
jgi:Flp pilus assembly protein TadG